MTTAEIGNLLEQTGLPVAYLAFPKEKAPPMPFTVYQFLYSNNFAADGEVYTKINRYMITLYSRIKDEESENKIETALNSIPCPWSKEEEWLEDNSCYQVTYEIEMEV